MGDLGQTIAIIGVMLAVLLGAYYVTKFLAKRGKRLTQSKHIRVIDQIYVASDKQIALINVGGKNILVGITNQSINLISEMDREDNEEIVRQEESEADTKGLPTTVRDFFKKAMHSREDLRNARQDIKDNNQKGNDFASVMKSVNNENEKENSSPEGKSE